MTTFSYSVLRTLGLAAIACVPASIARAAVPTLATEWAELRASDRQAGDAFGYVAVDGSTMVIGAPLATTAASSVGAAYVFELSSGSWTQVAKLRMSDEQAGDEFAIAVAIDGDTIAVGTRFKDDLGGNSGAVYVFVKPISGWTNMTQTAKFTAPDGEAGDQFGAPLAISGNSIAVGAPNGNCPTDGTGAAYVFVGSGASWSLQAKLCAADAAVGDTFGDGVGLDVDTAVIGAVLDDVAGGAGSAYVFTRTGVTWTQQAKLTSADAAAGDRFGHQVAVHGETAIIGAPYDDGTTGAAYIFTRGANATWDNGSADQQAKLVQPDGTGDIFGHAVALEGDLAVVGAVHADGAVANTGAAYLFSRYGTGWYLTQKLASGDGVSSDSFSYAGWNGVALSGDVVAIGAQNHVHSGGGGGAAYVYALRHDVPTVSIWGLIVLALSVVAAGTVVVTRQRSGNGIEFAADQ